jgi:hypothetical protein
MRNFFGYNNDGELEWQIVRTGGFPPECNPRNPDCTHPLSVEIRRHVMKSPNAASFENIVEFNCACECECGCTAGVCQCAVCSCTTTKIQNSFYCGVDECLKDKLATTVSINNSPVDNESTTVLIPSSLLTVKLETPGIPDGSTVTLQVDKLHADPTVALTFTDGISNEVTFRTPAQGSTGFFTLKSKYISQFSAAVKGFA